MFVFVCVSKPGNCQKQMLSQPTHRSLKLQEIALHKMDGIRSAYRNHQCGWPFSQLKPKHPHVCQICLLVFEMALGGNSDIDDTTSKWNSDTDQKTWSRQAFGWSGKNMLSIQHLFAKQTSKTVPLNSAFIWVAFQNAHNSMVGQWA